MTIGNVCPAMNITIAGAHDNVEHQPEPHPFDGGILERIDLTVDGYEYKTHICRLCGCNYTVKVKL